MNPEADSGKVRQVGDMRVFQQFRGLALQVEAVTRQFGPDFRWLRVQCLRSSESVCANLTEGFYSQYSTEYLQALYRCRREARETMGHLDYAADVRQLTDDGVAVLSDAYEEALKLLANLISSIESKIRSRGKAKEYPNTVREGLTRYELAGDWITNDQG